MKTVKVTKLGSSVTEVCLEDGATVEAAINAANHHLTGGETVQVEGVKRQLSDQVSNGEMIVVSPAIKGGIV